METKTSARIYRVALIVALAVGIASTANADITLVSSEGDTLDPTGASHPNTTLIGIYNDIAAPGVGRTTYLTIPAGQPGSWTGNASIQIPPARGGTNTYYGVVDFSGTGVPLGAVDLWESALGVCKKKCAEKCSDPYGFGVLADYEYVCTGIGDVTISLWNDNLNTVIDTITIHQVVEPVVDCPSADPTGDCLVDFSDFAWAAQWPTTDLDSIAFMADQWLTTDPCIPDDMAYISGGMFEMGDSFNEGNSWELPVHTVEIAWFFMGKYEITNGQYCEYLNSALADGLIDVTGTGVYKTGSIILNRYCNTHSTSSSSQIDYNDVTATFSVRTKFGRDMSNDPMLNVTWYGAAAYCNWRSKEEGREQCYNLLTWNCNFSKKGYRLPTEAEWEYAARGRLSDKRFPWGDKISHAYANYYSHWEEGSAYYSYDFGPTEGLHPAWYDGTEPYTSPVGNFSANGYGLYDMTGNVWEWCNDRFDPNYYDCSPMNNPTGPPDGSFRLARGGGWNADPQKCRIADRYSANMNFCGVLWGFRIVLDLE